MSVSWNPLMDGTAIVTTERLILRHWRESDHKPFARLNADLSGGDAGVFEGFGEESVGVFVFVPCVDAGDGGLRQRGWLGFHALAGSAVGGR